MDDEKLDRAMRVETSSAFWVVDPCDERLLFAAVRDHAERGVDSLVQLTTVGGAAFTVRASLVECFVVTTAESRKKDRELCESATEDAKPDGWQDSD